MTRVRKMAEVSGVTVGGVAAVWGAALILVLQLQHLPLSAEHAVCGPWGCGPPLSALLACHGFWIVFLSLPTVLCGVYLKPAHLARVGAVASLVGILGLAGVGAWEAVFWLGEAGEWRRQFFLQRWVFTVATLVDVPIVPVGLAGLSCLVVASKRRKHPRRE